MGLDQSAYVRKEGEKEGKEIAYWRKHNRLQGWMEDLWKRKNPTGKEFNCVNLILEDCDIDALELAIAKRDLPETRGFFFGNDSYGYEADGKPYADYDTDIKFIKDARDALACGHELYYRPWW